MPGKIADQPHWITIALGILSPILAGVAVWISTESLRTTKQAMKISQRAYLSCNIDTTVETPQRQKSDADIISLKTVLTFRNLGNTPAYLDSNARTAGLINASRTGWIGEPLPSSISRLITAIAPKDEIAYLTRDPIPLKIGAAASHDSGEVHWHDVFGDSHVERWCETVQLQVQFVVTPCDEHEGPVTCTVGPRSAAAEPSGALPVSIVLKPPIRNP